MSPPLVTVAMIAFNAQRFIAESIEGVLAQTWTDLELVIVDDGSADATPEIVRRYAESDARVRFCPFEQNRGMPAARTATLELARGFYFAVNDSDDISRPDRLEWQLAVLESQPSILICGSNLQIIAEDGRRLGSRKNPETSLDIRRNALRTNPIANSSVCARTSALREAGGYDPTFPTCEDYDLTMRVLAVGEGYNVQDELVSYRLSSEQSMTKDIKRFLTDGQRVRRRWLLHPRFRSAAATLWFCEAEAAKLLPAQVVSRTTRRLFVDRDGDD